MIKKSAGIKVKAKAKVSVKPKKAARKAAVVKPPKKTAAKAAVSAALKIIRPKRKPAAKKIAPPPKEPDITPALVPAQEIIVPQSAQPKIVAEEKVTEVKKEDAPAKTAPPAPAPQTKAQLKELELGFPITVKDLAVKLQEKPSVLIKALMEMKVMAGINQTLEESTVQAVCDKFGFQLKKAPEEEELILRMHKEADRPEFLQPRPPIVTFMGHVDHGKTSLLDSIRKAKVAESEHGGITQHIGAYRVILSAGEITFLDTPGHEAFTAMRSRGAGITDIVVLVVAADEGIMPQTQEAIDHARAAGVSIIVALNKIDKPEADAERVKKQLSEVNLMPEDWGGKIITVGVSAKTGQGIDTLLEMILLEAQMLELKANPKKKAYGVVIESRLSAGKGPVVTLLVQNGTLRLNETIIAGKYFGKIRAMFNDHVQPITAAAPSFPAEILGLSGTPAAGEQFFVIEDEKQARELALKRQEKERQQQIISPKRINLEDLYSQIKAGKLKELNLIIKADVQGSLEAIKETIGKINVSEIKLNIIHEGVGGINSSDVILAIASNALLLGFNVTADERAKELINKEGVDLRIYNIIYELANDIKAALEGMLEPKLKKVFLGRAEIRKVFKLTKAGAVAGCFVVKGKITRSASVDLVRNGQPVFEGKISSLKRFKEDVREVAEGFECGITLAGFDDLMEGDTIEAYEIEKIARKL